MNLAGKCEPDRKTIDGLVEEGFSYFELYLSTNILDEHSVEQLAEECEESNGEIKTVHTPHIPATVNMKPYFKKTDALASELDATLVVDSNPTSTRYAPNVFPQSDIKSDVYAYENDPSVSKYYMKNYQLEKGQPLVLDTAHLHMSEPSYMPFIENLLQTCSYSELPVIHLADGIRHNDGLPFGQGTVDLETVVGLLETYEYQGTVVLEVPQSHQPEALQMVNQWLD